LPQGKYYIEKDGWGWARFNKLEERPRVLVQLIPDEHIPDDDYPDNPDNEPTNPDEVVLPDVTLPDGVAPTLSDDEGGFVLTPPSIGGHLVVDTYPIEPLHEDLKEIHKPLTIDDLFEEES